MYGSVKTGIFLKVIMCIIKTVFSAITTLRTWNLSIYRNIFQTITKTIARNIKTLRNSNLRNWLIRKLKNGTDQKRAEDGILHTLTTRCLENVEIWYARNVMGYLKLFPRVRLNFVQQDAKVDTICELIDHSESGTKQEYAQSVIQSFQQTDGARHKLVVENVRLLSEKIEPEVYDLHVEDKHEFFANGVLVSNSSDATDYFLTEAFPKHFKR